MTAYLEGSGVVLTVTPAQRNERIRQAIKKQTDEALVSREASRAMLIREGIYTEGGDLKPEFGGNNKKSAGKTR